MITRLFGHVLLGFPLGSAYRRWAVPLELVSCLVELNADDFHEDDAATSTTQTQTKDQNKAFDLPSVLIRKLGAQGRTFRRRSRLGGDSSQFLTAQEGVGAGSLLVSHGFFRLDA